METGKERGINFSQSNCVLQIWQIVHEKEIQNDKWKDSFQVPDESLSSGVTLGESLNPLFLTAVKTEIITQENSIS